MAQITYRANLSAKSFPFLSENLGQTVIVPQYDNTYNRQLTNPEDMDRDAGIPQIYYGHNIMPSVAGIQSVGYTPITVSAAITLQNIWLLRNDTGDKIYMARDASASLWVLIGGVWVSKGAFGTNTSLITIAYVGGITYVHVQNHGCLQYDFGLGVFIPVTLTALVVVGVGAIIGICASSGYLLAWNASTVAWSSLTDPTDFTPSLETGAGSGSVESARGAITFCVPHFLGFVAYTTDNAVFALFTSNATYPFQFKEIVDSGGLSSLSLIAQDTNTGDHYVYTTSGLQRITVSGTQAYLPEVTDFVAGRLFEDYDETTGIFSTQNLTTTMAKRISLVADRYLIISYGVTNLTHAIVYDTAHKRFGKLKIPHVAVFEYQIPSALAIEIPRQSIGFLQVDGTIKILDFSTSSALSSGVLLLGKYQFIRQRLMQLDTITLENLRVGATFSLGVLSALDGKNPVAVTPYLAASNNLQRKYTCRTVGVNHSLLLKGAFSIVSLILQFSAHGKR